MSIPLQASIPLALRLHGESQEPNITKLVQTGASAVGHTVNDFNFIRANAKLEEATDLFKDIIRAIHVHPDWAQLHAFFSKRYSKREMFSDRDLRKLVPPKEFANVKDPKVTANFKTDPSLAGLAKDIKTQLAVAGRTIRSGIIGTDPLPVAIGPAIGLALGPGAYMDLIYRDIYNGNPSSKDHTAEEWANLWADIADWVYEYDSTALENHLLGSYTYKPRTTDADRKSFRPGSKIPKGFLATDAIDAADAIHSAFKQIAANPKDFYGIEWDFLELEMDASIRQQFYARFGTELAADHTTNLKNLFLELDLENPDRRVSKYADIHTCPYSLSGADWEKWMLEVRGGHVLLPQTRLQALLAVMFTSQLPLNLVILPPDGKVPAFRDSDTIYM